jgi:hypothetical protein
VGSDEVKRGGRMEGTYLCWSYPRSFRNYPRAAVEIITVSVSFYSVSDNHSLIPGQLGECMETSASTRWLILF